ncbi:MAG: hypothetical protein KKF16_05820 [Euryarchaeota archaeon]|nr:hypothetical protein [Euryarchaeota archaeon]MBU4607971.1 hypothetical protein [Euryarchaeota archaeon]MBV1730549.1 hypothetical protein [Methanobacterium sp.]MBV1755768.1 hypothetical protein [Methanobacterium sp.]MBV1767163.1 hypothetical protein [Methanobacterium sp.]
MKSKLTVFITIVLITFIFGCIQSDSGSIEELTPQINDHLKKGDGYYNQAAQDLNNFNINSAIENSNQATNEFNMARSSASEALIYAQNSKDNVFIQYIELAVLEIDAKLNATSELRSAAQSFQSGRNQTGNTNLKMANGLMQDALKYQKERETLVSQNPAKFKDT